MGKAAIAFAGTIAKFAIDLKDVSVVNISLFGQFISFKLTILVYIFSALTVLLASLGITARARGLAVDPQELMSDEWFALDEDMHKGYIISSWIATMAEYRKLAQRKTIRLNLTVLSFNIALFSGLRRLIQYFFSISNLLIQFAQISVCLREQSSFAL